MSIATSQIRSAPFVHIFSKFGHHENHFCLTILMKLENCEGRSIRGSKDLCTSILTTLLWVLILERWTGQIRQVLLVEVEHWELSISL
uniref:Uncharacterized protein n=1 Tax=Salix viminalis TaxID=40686 RepID=A0A6N2KFK9_SALVM